MVMVKKFLGIVAYDGPLHRRIRELVSANPKKGNSAIRFALYRTGMTVREYVCTCDELLRTYCRLLVSNQLITSELAVIRSKTARGSGSCGLFRIKELISSRRQRRLSPSATATPREVEFARKKSGSD
jgi:hypothetical protein